MNTNNGFCHCGCGQLTELSKFTYSRANVRAGEPNRFIKGHSLRTKEAIEKNKRAIKSKEVRDKQRKSKMGEKNPNWKGEFVTSDDAARHRARTRYSLGKCQKCADPATDRHHKDGNVKNFSEDNIMILCRRCHMKIDGRLEIVLNGINRRKEA